MSKDKMAHNHSSQGQLCCNKDNQDYLKQQAEISIFLRVW